MTNFYQLFFGGHYNSFVQFLFEAKIMNAADFYAKYQTYFKEQSEFAEYSTNRQDGMYSLSLKDDYVLFICFAKAIGFLSELPELQSPNMQGTYSRMIRTKLSSADMEVFNTLHRDNTNDIIARDKQILALLGYEMLFLSANNPNKTPDNKCSVFITKAANVPLFKQLNVPLYRVEDYLPYDCYIMAS